LSNQENKLSMKKIFLVFLLLANLKPCPAQYGYQCGDNYISLQPKESSLRFVSLKKSPFLNKDLNHRNKNERIVTIADNAFLIDSTLRKELAPIYESKIYNSEQVCHGTGP